MGVPDKVHCLPRVHFLFLGVHACANQQVYAVEFTDMANHARRLVAKNGMEDVVEVIQCSVEDLKLDAKVRANAVGSLNLTNLFAMGVFKEAESHCCSARRRRGPDLSHFLCG